MTKRKTGGPKGYTPKFERGIQNTTKSVDVPTPKPSIPNTPVSKPFTNPIKTAINKIPNKLEKGVKKIGSKLKEALVDPAVKVGKAYAAGDIPLTTPRQFKKVNQEIKKRVAKRNIEKVVKDVTGKKMGGRAIPEGPEGAGLRALKAEAPEVTSKMGYKKKGGIVAGINNIKGMKSGGMCRGMGAATKGGSFNVS